MTMPGDFLSKVRRRSRSSERIGREAAAWIALREGRGLTPDEKGAFETWLAHDPRHAAAVEELESAWRSLDRLAQYPRPRETSDDPDFFARPRQVRRRIAVPATLFAAAAAAACAIFWFRPTASSVAPGPIEMRS